MNVEEQATGCVANMQDGGPFWLSEDKKVSDEEAAEAFVGGREVHAPNAGAGSYRAVLSRLGFTFVDVLDWTSSAGDWVFAVRRDEVDWVVCQTNRYPHHGFAYTAQPKGEYE